MNAADLARYPSHYVSWLHSALGITQANRLVGMLGAIGLAVKT